MTPEELIAALQQATAALNEATLEYAKCLKDEATAKNTYKLEYAKRYLTIGGTVAEREAQCLNALAKEYTDASLAEAFTKATKAALDRQYAELHTLQSIGATLRAEMQLQR